MSANLKAIVAGGGIGGLTVATALAQRGWTVTIFERQPEVRASGSGIYIWENGLRVLGALGVREIGDSAFRGFAFEQRDRSGNVIDAGVLPPDVRLITVPRGRLLEGLRRAAERAGVEIRTSAEVIGASANAVLHLSGGQTEAADLVIGADGVWSAVRRSLGLELVHEQTAEGGLRTIVAGTQDDLGAGGGRDKYIENWNGNRRLLITPISQSEIYLAFTCPKSDRAALRSPLDRALWKSAFPHWGHLIDRVEQVLPWGAYSIIKVSTWSSGHTAIMGDAAHAQPPNLGQGAGMAMQSGLSLATHMEGLADRRDIPDRLAKWEAGERGLVDHCQKWSCLYGEIAFLPDEFRNQTIGRMMADPWIGDQLLRAARSEPTGTTAARQHAIDACPA